MNYNYGVPDSPHLCLNDKMYHFSIFLVQIIQIIIIIIQLCIENNETLIYNKCRYFGRISYCFIFGG